MSEKPKAKPIPDDPKQSAAFKKAVRLLDADGNLDSEKGDVALNALMRLKSRAD